MQFSSRLQTAIGAAIGALVCSMICAAPLSAQETQGKEAAAHEAKGLPPRATPGDYRTHTQVGAVTIAAEFDGHSVPAADSVLSTDSYVVVEVGIFGGPGAHTTISDHDFSLRLNSKKNVLPSQPYSLVFESLMDPEWAPPESDDSKSKTSIGSGGSGQNPGDPPKVVHPPFALKRGWEQAAQKAAMPEGDRELPTAGLLFFRYGGKVKNIDSIELIYEGVAGKATIELHP